MSRLVFRLQPIPTASGSIVRLDTASGSNTPADVRTLGGNVIDGATIRSGPHAGALPSVLGPDGATTLYQKTLDYRGQVVGSPVTLTGEDDNPSAPTAGAATTNASLLTSGTLSAARLPDLSGTYAPVAAATTTQAGAAYTLALTDAGTVVEFSNASAVTLTVPPNSSVAFPVGATVVIRQYGAGQVAVTPGAAVTIRSRGAALKLAGQYAEATLTKRATDEWVLSGDVTA